MFKVRDVYIDGQKSPMGIEEPPAFRIVAQSSVHSTEITAYRVQIGERPDFAPSMVWDSGVVSESSIDAIACPDHILQPHTRYYLRSMIWNNHGEQSSWSDVVFFDTAFMKDQRWESAWISPSENFAEPSPCVYMARDFIMDEGVVLAKLHITARGLYEVEINGQRVGEDYLVPGFFSYDKYQLYQSYDVTSFIHAGGNRLRALLGDGWYKGNLTSNWHRCYYGDKRELLAELHITLESGRKLVIGTDDQFYWWYSPVLLSEIYDGERYDARLEKPGSDQYGYHDEDFHKVSTRHDFSIPLYADRGNPVRIVERIRPKRMFTTPAGETVIDMGKNISGTVAMRVRGIRGSRVVLKCGEVLDQQGNFYTRNLEEFVLDEMDDHPSIQNIEYTLKGEGDEVYMPHFTYQGFRYVRVDEFPGDISVEHFEGIVLSSFVQQTGFFESSHPGLNQLFDNIITSQRGNFIGIPIAGPQRAERLGWTGDGQIFAHAACYNMFTQPFYRMWLKNIAADQFDDGNVPISVPFIGRLDSDEEKPLDSSAGWGDAIMVVPWLLYLHYRDVTTLRSMYPAMKRFIAYLQESGDNEYLYNEGYHFGDWFALDGGEDTWTGKTDTAFLASAYYAYSVKLMAKVAHALGENEDSLKYNDLFENIKKEINQHYALHFTSVEKATQTGCALALNMGIVSSSQESAALNTLLKLISQNGNHLNTGFIGTLHLMEVLAKYGRYDVAYRLLLNESYPSWLYTVNQGATSIWEHWNGIAPDGSFWNPRMNSFSHTAFGSVGAWLFSEVCGLSPLEDSPGYKQFNISPIVNQALTWAIATVDTIHGEIVSGWTLEDDQFTLTLHVPTNTTAIVVLPKPMDPEQLTKEFVSEGYHAEVTRAKDVQFIVGSGSYKFSYPMKVE